MVDEGKIRVARFNNVNFELWKMQIEHYLYQNDMYLSFSGKAQKPKEMSNGKWDILHRKALGVIRLSLASTIAFNGFKEKMNQRLDGDAIEDVRETFSFK